MLDLDDSEPEAKRLVQLFRSKEVRAFIIRTAMKLSGILFLVMVVATIAVRNSLSWLLLSPWFFPGFAGGCIGSYVALGNEYINWGLKTWANQHVC